MIIAILIYPTLLAVVLNFMKVNYFLVCTIMFVIPAFVIFENFGFVIVAKLLMYLVWIVFGLAKRRWYLNKYVLRSLSLLTFLVLLFFLLGVVAGNNIENILIATLVLLSPVLGYTLGHIFYYEQRPYYGWALVPGIVIFLCLFFIYVLGNFEIGARLVFGSYAVGGYLGHSLLLYLPAAIRFATVFLLLLIVIDLAWGGSRRYFILPLMLLSHFVVKHRTLTFVLISVTTVTWLLILLNYSFETEVNEKGTLNRGVGYRANEINIITDYILTSWKGLFFGALPGFQFEQIPHGTKGITDVGPRFHNFYYTIFANLGLIGSVLFCVILFRNFKFREIFRSDVHSVLVASWLVSMYFDQPPDGMWLLGYGIAAAGMQKR